MNTTSTAVSGQPSMTATSLSADHSATGTVLDVVIPVYNEAATLADSVTAVHRYLTTQVPYRCRITIADNASSDQTWAIARRLARTITDGSEIRVVHLDAKGRGRALRQVWSTSDAQVLAYMDVDLSTDLSALLPLVAPLVSGHSHIAIGSRLDRSARVLRGPKREFISRAYNLLLRGTLWAHFSDAQCGFKAIRADAAHLLLPLVQDTEWFFDTELLVLAERAGMRIHEVPVDWVDDPDSRVDIKATALADLRGVARLARDLVGGRLPLRALRAELASWSATRADGRDGPPTPPPRGLLGQLIRFAIVGVASTLVYSLLFYLLRAGADMGAQGANFVALGLSAIANTAANRRMTFGIRGAQAAIRHQGQGLIVFALGWALTSGALALQHHYAPSASAGAQVAILIAANLAATLVRFVLLRSWVFARRDPQTTPTSAPKENSHHV